MGALEITGYVMALIDLFDQTGRLEALLLRFKEFLRAVSRRFPLKRILLLYLGAGAIFSVMVRNNAEAEAILSGSDQINPVVMIVLLIVALPIYFAILMALVHLLHLVFRLFASHPKGILGSIGLALLLVPDLWRLLAQSWA